MYSCKNVYIFICTCIHVHSYTRTCIHVHSYTCTCIHVKTCTYSLVHVFMFNFNHVYVHVIVFNRVYVHVFMFNHVRVHVFSYQRAVKEFVMTVDSVYGKQFDDFFVGFEGSFGAKHVTPRSLSARFLGNLVCLEGIVTKCECESIFLYTCTLFNWSLLCNLLGSLIRPKVIKSVHYCPTTKKTIERKYSDLTSLEPFPSSAVYPTKVVNVHVLYMYCTLYIYSTCILHV